VEEKVLIAAHS